MTSYLYQAPTGVPGDITRTDETNVEPALQAVQGSDYPVVGMGVKYTSDGAGIQVPSGDAATTFAGVMVREVPSISSSSSDDSSLSPFTPTHDALKPRIRHSPITSTSSRTSTSGSMNR